MNHIANQTGAVVEEATVPESGILFNRGECTLLRLNEVNKCTINGKNGDERCHTSMENALFEFFYSTGCRIGEVAKLNRDDINFAGNSVIVHGKGDKEREVYFNIRCSIWLKRYLDERIDDEHCLFVTERKPIRRMSVDTLRYIVKRISNRAGIKKTIHPHQLRHSYATHMVDNGAPLEVIQSLLGHEKSETTRIYAHLSGKLRHDLYSKYF